MGTLYTYTGIKNNPDTNGIISDVRLSTMDNKNIITATWDADYPAAPMGTLKILWNSDSDWLGKDQATTQNGMWNTDLSDQDKSKLDSIVRIKAPYL